MTLMRSVKSKVWSSTTR